MLNRSSMFSILCIFQAKIIPLFIVCPVIIPLAGRLSTRNKLTRQFKNGFIISCYSKQDESLGMYCCLLLVNKCSHKTQMWKLSTISVQSVLVSCGHRDSSRTHTFYCNCWRLLITDTDNLFNYLIN